MIYRHYFGFSARSDDIRSFKKVRRGGKRQPTPSGVADHLVVRNTINGVVLSPSIAIFPISTII